MSQVDPVLIDAVVDARPVLARLFAEACQRGLSPRPVGGHRYFLLLDQLEPDRLVTYALRADGQLCAATWVDQLDPAEEAEDFLRHYPTAWLGVAAGQLLSSHCGACEPIEAKVRSDLIAARAVSSGAVGRPVA